jgi:eukaryotic-like serine/threonine-protein kinase
VFDLVWLDRCPLLEPYRGDPDFMAQRARVAARVEPIVAALSSPL